MPRAHGDLPPAAGIFPWPASGTGWSSPQPPDLLRREQLAPRAGPDFQGFPAFFGVSHVVEYTFVL